MAKCNIFVLAVIVVAIGVAAAATQDDIEAVRTAIRPIIDECGKEFGITTEQVLAAKASGGLDTLDSCFYACFFKKIGFIDANGLFDANGAVEKNKKHYKSADDIAKIEQVAKTCSSVNDATVSDGEKACERAKLLLACFLKEKAYFIPLTSS